MQHNFDLMEMAPDFNTAVIREFIPKVLCGDFNFVPNKCNYKDILKQLTFTPSIFFPLH